VEGRVRVMADIEVANLDGLNRGAAPKRGITDPRAEDLSNQLCWVVYVRLRREEKERSGELELSTGYHARARSCDADVTTRGV
jgi:hypothetical protein